MKWLLLILLLPVAHALSASPASHMMYTPDGASSYPLTIHNDEGRAVEISITAVGPFSASVTVPEGFTLQPQERRTVDVRVAVPADARPGLLEGGLLIEARPTESASTVSAAGAVMHSIRLRTPLEGAFIEGEILPAGSAVGRPTTVTLVLTNTGTESVSATAAITRNGERLTSQAVELAPGAMRNVVGSWTPDQPGEHTVTAEVSYAGKELLLHSLVTVGDLSVAIEEITVGAFVLGQPFRASVHVRNQYGQALLVTPSASVLQNGSIRTAATGVAVSIPAGESAALPVFLESSGLAIGEAELRAQIIYAGQVATLTIPAAVYEDRLFIGTSAETSESRRWLPAVLVAVIVTVIIWFVLRSKKRR